VGVHLESALNLVSQMTLEQGKRVGHVFFARESFSPKKKVENTCPARVSCSTVVFKKDEAKLRVQHVFFARESVSPEKKVKNTCPTCVSCSTGDFQEKKSKITCPGRVFFGGDTPSSPLSAVRALQKFSKVSSIVISRSQ